MTVDSEVYQLTYSGEVLFIDGGNGFESNVMYDGSNIVIDFSKVKSGWLETQHASIVEYLIEHIAQATWCDVVNQLTDW